MGRFVRQHDPVIENLTIRCRQRNVNLRGVDGGRRGVLRDSTVTGCGVGIFARLASELSVDGVRVEGNFLGISHEDSRLHIRDSLIQDNVNLPGTLGAGVYSFVNNPAESLLTIERTLITGNAAARGAGLALEFLTRAVVVNSTISSNRATGDGGGILTLLGAELELASSTVAFNQADFDGSGDGDGGGVWFSGDSLVTLRNSVLSHNTAAGPLVSTWDCSAPAGVILSAGYNLVHHTIGCQGLSGDPTNIRERSAALGPLSDHGGPTWTHSPLAASSVIDTGNPAGCAYDGDFDAGSPVVPLIVDQRGESRHVDGDGDLVVRCDIGSLELGGLFADGFESGDTSAWSTAVQSAS